MVAVLYWLVILSIPFLLAGFVLVGVLTPLRHTQWRRFLQLIAAYLVFAVYVGVTVYMMMPAHYLIEGAPDRGTFQPMWEMHGEEMGYAEQYAETNPDRYARDEQRVFDDRVWLVQMWSIPTATGFLAIVVFYYAGSRWRSTA